MRLDITDARACQYLSEDSRFAEPRFKCPQPANDSLGSHRRGRDVEVSWCLQTDAPSHHGPFVTPGRNPTESTLADPCSRGARCRWTRQCLSKIGSGLSKGRGKGRTWTSKITENTLITPTCPRSWPGKSDASCRDQRAGARLGPKIRIATGV